MLTNGLYRKDTASKIVINDLRELLDEMKESLEKSHYYIYDEINKVGSDNELLDVLNYVIANLAYIRQRRQDIIDYMDEIRINYRITDDINIGNVKLIGELENEIKNSRLENDRLLAEINNLSERIMELENERNKQIVMQTESNIGERIMELENERNKQIVMQTESNIDGGINELLELVNRNIQSLSVSEYLKSDVYKKKSALTGEESHRFKHSINNEELKQMYINNGYKLTSDIVDYFSSKDKNGVTYQALSNRLKAMGVWVGRTK